MFLHNNINFLISQYQNRYRIRAFLMTTIELYNFCVTKTNINLSMYNKISHSIWYLVSTFSAKNLFHWSIALILWGRIIFHSNLLPWYICQFEIRYFSIHNWQFSERFLSVYRCDTWPAKLLQFPATTRWWWWWHDSGI